MNMMTVAAGAVCISVLILSVKNMKSEMGHLITIAAVVVIMAATVPYILKIAVSVREMGNYGKAGGKYIEPILKITGISYISQIGSELCADCGENALASRVEMAGKIAIGVITIPIAKEAFERIIGILT